MWILLPRFPTDYRRASRFLAWQHRRGVRHLMRCCQVKEQWKPYFNGCYEVSSRGRVRRLKPCRGARVGRDIARQDNGHGYLAVHLWSRNIRKRRYIHRIVAELFIGPCPIGKEVNHKDGNKSHNGAVNLEYVTRSENHLHAFRTGIRTPIHRVIIPASTIRKVRRLRKRGRTLRQIEDATGVSHSYCSRITNNLVRRKEKAK